MVGGIILVVCVLCVAGAHRGTCTWRLEQNTECLAL